MKASKHKSSKHKKPMVTSEENTEGENLVEALEECYHGKGKKATKYKKSSNYKRLKSEESKEDGRFLKKHFNFKYKKVTKHRWSARHKICKVILEESSEDGRVFREKHRCGRHKKASKSKKSSKKKSAHISESTISSGNESSDGEVQTARKRNGKRVRNRRDYGFFCDKQELKIACHWFTWHKDERLVREIEDLPKCSKPRTKKIASLRNKGNLKHNLIVWDTGVGKIVPIKRPFFG